MQQQHGPHTKVTETESEALGVGYSADDTFSLAQAISAHQICTESSFTSLMVGRGNARWTSSNGGHSCPYQNCSRAPSAEKNTPKNTQRKQTTGRGSLLYHPPCPPDDPLGPGTELNSTEHSGSRERWRSWGEQKWLAQVKMCRLHCSLLLKPRFQSWLP